MKSKRLRQLGLVMLLCAASAVLALATSPASQAAAPSPMEARYKPMDPLPAHTPCLAADRKLDEMLRLDTAGDPPAASCPSWWRERTVGAHLANVDAMHNGQSAQMHPGTLHPEAVLYEIRHGAREILFIDLWCLPTISRPVLVRPLC